MIRRGSIVHSALGEKHVASMDRVCVIFHLDWGFTLRDDLTCTASGVVSSCNRDCLGVDYFKPVGDSKELAQGCSTLKLVPSGAVRTLALRGCFFMKI